MGMPVVSVASGGLPVVDTGTALRGTPVTEAPNGIGMRVTKVAAYGMPVAYETIGVAAAITPATFNGTPSAGVVMSNGNLTATHGTINPSTGVSSASLLSAGKYYFEVIVQVTTTSANAMGIMSAGSTFGTTDVQTLWTSLNLGPSTIIWSNGLSTGKNLGAAAVGDVFGFAVDLTARLAWVRRNNGSWNNDGTANPTTGVGGVVIGAGSFAPAVKFTNGAATDAFTGNFGASAFANPVPSGFTAGWPA
jgi:hypothetical protein